MSDIVTNCLIEVDKQQPAENETTEPTFNATEITSNLCQLDCGQNGHCSEGNVFIRWLSVWMCYYRLYMAIAWFTRIQFHISVLCIFVMLCLGVGFFFFWQGDNIFVIRSLQPLIKNNIYLITKTILIINYIPSQTW